MILRTIHAIPVSYLSLLISSAEFEMLIQYMGFPTFIRINDSNDALSFKNDVRTILRLLEDRCELRLMFQLQVISGLLLSGFTPDQVMDIVSCCPDYLLLFPEMPVEILAAGSWLPIPIIGIHHQRACIRYWIAGLLPEFCRYRYWPAWADGVMDTSARKAAINAAATIRLQSRVSKDVPLMGYPLVQPNGHVQISGGSLGLSLALGYHRLFGGNVLCSRILATGAIAPTGEVQSVEGVRQKAVQAAKAGYQVFIYPSACGRIQNPDGLELVPVGCLEEAVLFAQLYSPGKMANLILFHKMLKDPDLFISACCQIDRQWLKWAKTHLNVDSVINSLTKAPDQSSRLVERLVYLVANNRLQDAVCLSEFFGPQAVQNMMACSPASAFRWAVANLTICNHLGQTESAAFWAASAEQMLAEFAVQELTDCATYMNVHFIQLHHNHYVFRPKLPEFIGKILAIIEKQHRLLCENGYSVNRTLAALYGSITQNYGFCGPVYLREVEEYARLALQAFGSGRVPELDGDWRRQFNYLTYAYLDAGDFQQAETTLMRYLKIESRNDIWKFLDHFNSWQHALLSRFIADVQDEYLISCYLKWAQPRFHTALDPHHPWQLWLLHLGRMAQTMEDDPKACECYRRSVHHCLSGPNGPTVQAMALMPLAYWRQLPGADLCEIAVRVDQVLAVAGILNPDHFHMVFGTRDALSMVAENAMTLFPFSYR